MNTANPNRLVEETSPYLLQHAYNPVAWYPWGEEALQKAQEEDKPVLVSIGYSACHWCHVMEKECFEDEEVATYMNQHFINIKVDREERPDVDQIYMEAVQMMGMQGGWPLNVFLTADQKPFYGGTYFPKPNWLNLLQNVSRAYTESREDLEESAEKFVQSIAMSEVQRYGLQSAGGVLNKEDLRKQLDSIYKKFSRNFDHQEGGLKRAPKFPMPSHWLFLLRYYMTSKTEEARSHVLLTLDKMAGGGIYDQLGGGFARYSVDAAWFAPHFEKMLYDNGQLLSLYAEAYTLTKKSNYRTVLEDTVSFVKTELTSAEGGFYSALDADSEGEEGKYYVWHEDEFINLLGKDAQLIADYYQVKTGGNWENGQNILHTKAPVEEFAGRNGMTESEFREILQKNKHTLLAARSKRIRPGLDDKILTAWNGLMLKGLSDTYAALQKKEILTLAIDNAAFIKNFLVKTNGGLYRSFKNGQAKLPAYLEDYAFVIDGLLSLYQISFDEQWLALAQTLADYTLQHFFDEQEGFFYFTDDSATKLIARKKELFDNVIPASNSAIARSLHKLGTILDKEAYIRLSENMLKIVMDMLIKEPAYLTNWGCFATEIANSTAEIAIIGPESHAYALTLQQKYLPFKVIQGTTTSSSLPLLSGRHAIEEKTTLYVCYDKTCQLPVFTPEEALEQIKI